jgi:hypothetical protein
MYDNIYIYMHIGIIESKAGYSGGANKTPTYKTVCAGDGHIGPYFTCIFECIFMYSCMNAYLLMYVYIYIYICMYIYMEDIYLLISFMPYWLGLCVIRRTYSPVL